MRYLVLASDYDGTLADQGRVAPAVVEKLRGLKATGRRLVLVTGREMRDLVIVFPDHKVFDFVVAENGAVIYDTISGEERLLGQGPGEDFVRDLQRKGVHPLSVGRVIVATWVPHEQEVLEVIKASGGEHQVIFNKGAVMILPPGINKATGLQALLRGLQLSLHNVVSVGDAENDNSLLQAGEAAVAVGNALDGVKAGADWVTEGVHGDGVVQLVDGLMADDLGWLDGRLGRHWLELGVRVLDGGAVPGEGSAPDGGVRALDGGLAPGGGSASDGGMRALDGDSVPDGGVFAISPWRSGILLAGASGGGKTTFTMSIMEALVKKGYQFCLIDPEGDYLDWPGAMVIGNEVSLPSVEEIGQLLRDPLQNVIVCTLSVPLNDRPEFFSRLLEVIVRLRREYSRPHWVILDEAHHLVPGAAAVGTDRLPADFNNFIVVSTSPHALHAAALSKIGMIITIGENPSYPFEQFGAIVGCPVPGPADIPSLAAGEICVWEVGGPVKPFVVRYHPPRQLLHRHKKKYAQGEMGENSFVFTGEDKRLHLVANNLLMFHHIASGLDIETWVYHLQRKDFFYWFRDTVHDEELAEAAATAASMSDADAAASRRYVLDLIFRKYTA